MVRCLINLRYEMDYLQQCGLDFDVMVRFKQHFQRKVKLSTDVFFELLSNSQVYCRQSDSLNEYRNVNCLINITRAWMSSAFAFQNGKLSNTKRLIFVLYKQMNLKTMQKKVMTFSITSFIKGKPSFKMYSFVKDYL